MKLLITGGAGFIGSALVRHIIRHTSDSVVNVDKLTYAGNLASLAECSASPRYAFEQVDICYRAELDRVFAEYDPKVGGQRIENMEMEASFLLHFLGGLGHWAGAICPAIANRRQDNFDHRYLEAVEDATRVALLALAQLRGSRPGAGMR